MLSNLQKFNHLLNDNNLNRNSTNGNYGTGSRPLKQQRRYVAQSSAKEAEESRSQSVKTQQTDVCVKNGNENASADEAEIVDPKECELTGKSESEAKVEPELPPPNGDERSDEKERNSESSSQSTTE